MQKYQQYALKRTLPQYIRETREISAGLNITRDDIIFRLIEKGVHPSKKQIDEIIRVIRLDAMNAANTSLVECIERAAQTDRGQVNHEKHS